MMRYTPEENLEDRDTSCEIKFHTAVTLLKTLVK